jgi:heat shock protein HslJ
MNSLSSNILFLLLAFMILSLSSCKEEEETKLVNFWQLKQIEKRDVQPPIFIDAPEDLPIKVLFGPVGKLNIDSYCNTGTANYIERSATLEINQLSMTEMNCTTNEPIDWEAVFVYNFGLSEYFLIEDNTLIILTRGDYNLHFDKL